MRSKILKVALPVSMGLVLLTITLMGLLSTSLVGCTKAGAQCVSGAVLGHDGICYGPCPSGDYATLDAVGVCSSASAGGVYCCSGGGGNSGGSGGAYCNPGNTYNYSSQKCCPNNAPYYYPGTHGIASPGCYASCPYVGDCGSSFTKY